MNSGKFQVGLLGVLIILAGFLSVSLLNSAKMQNLQKLNQFDSMLTRYDHQCNFTHFVYENNFSLARQDELNRTFSKISQKITNLINVTLIANQTTSYQIFDVVPTLQFSNENQKAQIIGNDTIVYLDGQLKVLLNFKWKKIDSEKQVLIGSGIVSLRSDPLIYAKTIELIGTTYRYYLLDLQNVGFYSNQMSWVQLLPSNTQAWDSALIYRAINNRNGGLTLRNDLISQINNYFTYYLRLNVNDPDDMTMANIFEYVWNDPVQQRGNFSIEFQGNIEKLSVDQYGIQKQFQLRIKNYQDWKCGEAQTTIPLNPRVYGGGQEFISISFYENVLRYAIQNGRLDSILSKKYWQTDQFHFKVGELFGVFPLLAQKFGQNQQIKGNCKALKDNFKLIFEIKSLFDQFQVDLNLKCELFVESQKFSQFDAQLQLFVKEAPNRESLNFKLSRFTNKVSFIQVGEYDIYNRTSGEKIIAQSLNRLYDSNLFGSGWPSYPKRDNPQFLLMNNTAVVFDFSTTPKMI